MAFHPNLDPESYFLLGIQSVQISYSLLIKWMLKFFHASGTDFYTRIL